MSSHSLASVALLLAFVANLFAAAAAIAVFATMRTTRRALDELRRVPDPAPAPAADPDTTAELARISAELETLGGLYEELTGWAHGAEARLPHPDQPDHDEDPATTAMPAAARPRPAHRP